MDEIKNIAKLLKIDLSQITPQNDAEIAEIERRQREEERTERYRKQAPQTVLARKPRHLHG